VPGHAVGGTTTQKKSTKVLPKVSANSLSSLGLFMRGAPNRKVSGGNDFQMG
jgi:hypothetical protein